MKIKPNIYQKNRHYSVIFLQFFAIAKPYMGLMIDCFPYNMTGFLFGTCTYTVTTIFLIIYTFSVGRTYCYSKVGCTISFLFYRKVYQWEDLQIKKYEKKFTYIVGRWSCGEADGVFFSVKPYKYHKMNGSPITLSEIFQPSKFYVLFPYEIKKYDMFPYPMADRDEFLGLLKEWGVKIEGLENENT